MARQCGDRVAKRCLLTSPLCHFATILYCSAWIAGCAYVPRRAAAPSPQPLPTALKAYYGYPSQQAQLATTYQLDATARYTRQLVRFPLLAPDVEPTEPVVEFEWFESTQPGRRPAIVFNPILGGDYPLERGLCEHLAAHGFHVALVHRKTVKLSPEYGVDHLELLLRQAVLRIRQIVDWLEDQDRVDPQRLGSYGISMGGIISAVSAAIEPRLRCHVISLAGGSIPDILLESHDRLITQPLSLYLARNRMARETLERFLRQSVRTDPIQLAPYVDGRRVFMVIAVFDRTIGRQNALRLWRALGRPEAVFLPLGHYTAYLSLPYLKYASLRFFKETLK